jgi:uncharacterized protein (TIGR03086 family)
MSHRHPYQAEIQRVERTGSALADQVAQLAADDWIQPTPCQGWDVRQLVGHVGSIVCDLEALASGEPLPPPLRDAQLTAAPAVAETIRDGLERGIVAWRRTPLAVDRAFPWGTTPAVRALQFTAVEIVVHAWDLAAATGIPATVRDDDAEALDVVARWHLPEAARPGLFDAPVPAPAGAGPLDRLVAVLGRRIDVPAPR